LVLVALRGLSFVGIRAAIFLGRITRGFLPSPVAGLLLTVAAVWLLALPITRLGVLLGSWLRLVAGLGLSVLVGLLTLLELLVLELLLFLWRERLADLDNLPRGLEAVRGFLLVVANGQPVRHLVTRPGLELCQIDGVGGPEVGRR